MDWKARCRQIKREIPALCLAFRHPETPRAAKLVLALAIGYALSPVDLIPDFIPVLGYLDDLLLLPALILLAVRLIPEPVYRECREEAAERQAQKPGKRWYCALPVVCLWAAVVGGLLWLVLK